MSAALVIMAAGMGSRYGGNKQIDGVGPNNEILMEYSIFDAVRAGFDKIVLIIKPDIKDLIANIVERTINKINCDYQKQVKIEYVFQDFEKLPAFYHVPESRKKPLGTLHAVLCTKDVVTEPFCVINADDYYGVDAYKIIYEELMRMPKSGRATMVGYKVKNTVTEYGTVSRGVCNVQNGNLISVKETLKIKLFSDGKIADICEEPYQELNPDTIVSMNFWGFSSSCYTDMSAYFENWLMGLQPDDIKSECYLPSYVCNQIDDGKLSVSVLNSSDKWFGMTYHEDRENVVATLKELHENGTYPKTIH